MTLQHDHELVETYYQQAIGLRIVGVEHKRNDFQNVTWSTLVCEKTADDGTTHTVRLRICSDELSNQPGWLDGLEQVRQMN